MEMKQGDTERSLIYYTVVQKKQTAALNKFIKCPWSLPRDAL